jgi:hypothetical protein
MKITKQFLESGMSNPGAWTREQLELIGVSWPPRKGWKKQLIGKEISPWDAELFLSLNKKPKTRQANKQPKQPRHGARKLSKGERRLAEAKKLWAPLEQTWNDRMQARAEQAKEKRKTKKAVDKIVREVGQHKASLSAEATQEIFGELFGKGR